LSIEGRTALTQVDVHLARGGGLAGRLLRRPGEPQTGYQVLLWTPGQLDPSVWGPVGFFDVRTDAQGRYTVRGLAPGRYRVAFAAPGQPADFNLCLLSPSAEATCRRPYPPFYPSAGDIVSAHAVTVTAGTVTPGIDLVLERIPVYLPQVGRTFTSAADLVATLAAHGSFDILLQTLTAAGLTTALESAGPFTILAPTDAAFAALPAGALDQLLQNPTGQLTQILLFHILPGKVTTADVTNGMQVVTQQGHAVTFEVGGGWVRVNGANVVAPDIAATNGVIHAIDAVLLPPPE
jgi:hypothetical protein